VLSWVYRERSERRGNNLSFCGIAALSLKSCPVASMAKVVQVDFDAIVKIAERIVERFRPQRVILFSSQAKGQAHESVFEKSSFMRGKKRSISPLPRPNT
jgi:hypothetical protein